MKSVFHPRAAEPCAIGAVHLCGVFLRDQCAAVIDRMVQRDLVPDQVVADRAGAVESDHIGRVVQPGLQRVHPVGQVNLVTGFTRGLGIDPRRPDRFMLWHN